MTPTLAPIEAVSQRVERFADDRRREADGLGAEAVAFVASAAAALTGGKRLRARFCLTGWQAVAESAGVPAAPAEAAIAAAAALEIFHAAALVHDDLIDNSDLRRGRPSAHRAWETSHRDAGWAGDAGAFGRSAAVLLGDLLVAWSDDLLEEGLRGAAHADAARTAYAVMRRDVTIGQFLDVAEEAAHVTAPDGEHAARALRVASLKSARYSVEQPLLIGAAIAGADAAQRDALSRFGHPIGLAFQLRDDVLGVFGDSAVTGKPSGDDLREGKRTLLVAYAREGMDAATRARFDAELGDPGLDDGAVARLQMAIVDTGALARVETHIDDYEREAEAALDGADLGAEATATLRALARAAISRTS